MAQSNPGYDSDNSVERQHRREAFDHELIQSEEEYVAILCGLVEGVYVPLKKYATKVGLTQHRVEKVFRFLETMQQFHVQFLESIREQERVLDTFSQFNQFTSMYEDYANAYSSILDECATWQTMQFREFVTLKLQQTSKQTNKTIDDRLSNLPWYLYRPFDRITEYYRYLKDLKRLSRRHDPDINDKHLQTVISQVKRVYKHIHQNEDKFQTKTTLMEVQLQIHGIRSDIKLVNDGRYFIYNRRCQMRRRMLGKKYKKIHIYLFNDLFVWVSERGKFKGSYSFFDPSLEIKQCGNPGEATFSIGQQGEKHPREIVCVDDQSRNQLMDRIKKTYLLCLRKVQNANEEQIDALRKKTGHETAVDAEESQTSIGDSSYGTELSVSSITASDALPSHHGRAPFASYIAPMMNPINENKEDSKGIMDSPSTQASKRKGKGHLKPKNIMKRHPQNGSGGMESDSSNANIQINLNQMSPNSNSKTNGAPGGGGGGGITPVSIASVVSDADDEKVNLRFQANNNSHGTSNGTHNGHNGHSAQNGHHQSKSPYQNGANSSQRGSVSSQGTETRSMASYNSYAQDAGQDRHDRSDRSDRHGRTRTKSDDKHTHDTNGSKRSHHERDESSSRRGHSGHSSHRSHRGHRSHRDDRHDRHDRHDRRGHGSDRNDRSDRRSDRKKGSSRSTRRGDKKEERRKDTDRSDRSEKSDRRYKTEKRKELSSEELEKLSKNDLIKEIINLRRERDSKDEQIQILQKRTNVLTDTIHQNKSQLDNLKQENELLNKELKASRLQRSTHGRAASLVTGTYRSSDTFGSHPLPLENRGSGPQRSPSGRKANNTGNGQYAEPPLLSTQSVGSYHSNSNGGHSAISRNGTESQLHVRSIPSDRYDSNNANNKNNNSNNNTSSNNANGYVAYKKKASPRSHKSATSRRFYSKGKWNDGNLSDQGSYAGPERSQNYEYNED